MLSKKDLTIKYTVYCVIIAAAALLQNVSGLWLEIGGAHCFLIVPVVILLSLGEDERNAAMLGLFGGMLWDAVSASHMGFNCILLMLLCYFSAALVNFVFRNILSVAVVSATIAALVYCVLYWLLIVLTRGGEGAALSFLWFYLPSFVYTAVIGVVLAVLLAPIKTKLNKGIKE